jgi:hypothetical protein
MQARRRTLAPNPQTNLHSLSQNRETKAHADTAKNVDLITAHRKSTEWSALEKPVAPLPAGNTFPGAGEGI